MKKTVLFAFVCALLMLFAMVFDYLYNDRFHRVEFHTVSLTDVQNVMEFCAPVEQKGPLWLMEGAAKRIDNITVGANAVITAKNRTYEGYVYQLEPVFEDVCRLSISVIGGETISGDATATVYGTLCRNLMFVPPECVISDESGKDTVFVEINGYAVGRQVELGRLHPENGQEILSGLFTSERIVRSPKGIRTGDRVSER